MIVDLSPASNVDHKLLIEDLMHNDVKDTVLERFKSYLQYRSYHIIINETKATSRLFQRGVPQGSVWDRYYFLFMLLNFHGF